MPGYGRLFVSLNSWVDLNYRNENGNVERYENAKMRTKSKRSSNILAERSTWLRIGYEFRRYRRRVQSDRFPPDYNIERTRLSRRPIP